MPFQICLEPSQRVFNVEAGERILAAGLAAQIKMPFGCRIGMCRSCRGRVISGSIDFGDAHPTYLPREQRDQGYALLCQATARSDLVIEVEEVAKLVAPQTSPAIVKTIIRPNTDVTILTLRLPLHLNLRFAAGQYLDVLLEDGVRRSYSIANPPRSAGVIDIALHIREIAGGLFTGGKLHSLKPLDKIQLEAPRGSFFLRDSEKPALLIASGTGYAPIRSILLETLPQHTGRKFVLYWGARTLQDIYLFAEANQLAEKFSDFSFVPVLSKPAPEDAWEGRTGYANHAAMHDIPDMSGWQVYACGTPALVEAARTDFTRLAGLPMDEFFADSFVTQAEVAAARS